MRTVRQIIKIVILCFLIIPVNSWAQEETTISIEDRSATVIALAELYKNGYLIEEVGIAGGAFLIENLESGSYDHLETAESLASQLQADLREVIKDSHIRVGYMPLWAQEIKKAQNAEEKLSDADLERFRAANWGIKKFQQLPGNIGYLDLMLFPPLPEGQDSLTGAMNLLETAGVIIIDLRNNGGGSSASVMQLASYFFETPTHLNTAFDSRDNSEEERWSLADVPGSPAYDKDLYIITSSQSFSAAEAFAFMMKNRGRATIIGEKTRGGAHHTSIEQVLEKYVAYLPYGTVTDPLTNSDWDGVGVIPDIEVSAKDALNVAQQKILKQLIETEVDEKRSRVLDFALTELTALDNVVELDEVLLSRPAGNYEWFTISYENGHLYMIEDLSKYELLPLSSTFFYVVDNDTFQLEIILNEDGTMQGMKQFWDAGTVSMYGWSAE